MLPLNVNYAVVRRVGLGEGLCESLQHMLAVKAFKTDSRIRPGTRLALHLPAVMEFLGPITSLWKEIIHETASRQVRIAKIHSLESSACKYHLALNIFLQAHLLSFHLIEAYHSTEESLWRFTVGILGDACQRWCQRRAFRKTSHTSLTPDPRICVMRSRL